MFSTSERYGLKYFKKRTKGSLLSTNLEESHCFENQPIKQVRTTARVVKKPCEAFYVNPLFFRLCFGEILSKMSASFCCHLSVYFHVSSTFILLYKVFLDGRNEGVFMDPQKIKHGFCYLSSFRFATQRAVAFHVHRRCVPTERNANTT